MASQIARLVVKRFQQQGPRPAGFDALTPREAEILEHIARGLQTKEIADLLHISERTVSSHLRNIYDKLHVRSRSAAVARFMERKT